MRAPLRLDIQRRDLAWAMLWALCSQRSDGALAEIRRNWQALGGCAEPLVALSVRSAFDLFLGVRKLPPGSEVAISAITHPDMPRLLRAHGLVPVPVDIEAATLAPSLDSVERALSPRTRALMLTHLLGGSVSTGSFLPLNETALSAVSKLALTRCIDVSRDRRVVPEDYPTPGRYARG